MGSAYQLGSSLPLLIPNEQLGLATPKYVPVTAAGILGALAAELYLNANLQRAKNLIVPPYLLAASTGIGLAQASSHLYDFVNKQVKLYQARQELKSKGVSNPRWVKGVGLVADTPDKRQHTISPTGIFTLAHADLTFPDAIVNRYGVPVTRNVTRDLTSVNGRQLALAKI